MIVTLHKEPLINKAFKIIFIILILSNIIQFIASYRLVNDIQKHELQMYEQVVGNVIEHSSASTEQITQSVFKADDVSKSLGKAFFLQYGYDEKFKLSDNTISGNIYKNYLIEAAIVNFLFIVVILIVLFYCCRIIFSKLYSINSAVKKIIDGDHSIKLEEDDEGLICKLSHNFNVMSNRMQLTMEDIIVEKEKIKALINDISHQLKTPLASIGLFNDMLIEHNLTENEEREILSKGKNEISKLNWLTKSLVQISRLETGMIILELKDSDIKNTIINAVNSIYLKLKEKDISIHFDSVFSCSIKHDPKWSEEAICNILENSIKYTDPHGCIKVSMTKSEIATNIIIEDTGIGIHKDELTKIFNRFYRGKSERVQNSEGSGVGLYLTKWIIENQGGAIRVKSEPDKGTCFTILFFHGDNQ